MNVNNLVNLIDNTAAARIRTGPISYPQLTRDYLTYAALGIQLALDTYLEYLPKAKVVSPLYDEINGLMEDLKSEANKPRTLPTVLPKT